MLTSRLYLLVLMALLIADGSRVEAQVTAVDTAPVCGLIGLGGTNRVPYNFPGVDEATMTRYRATAPGLRENSLPPGQNAAVPLVIGTDLGAPFVHDDVMYFSFGDAQFAPAADSSVCTEGATDCQPRALNDDLLASATITPWSGERECIALRLDRGASADDFSPITWNGSARDGGHDLGPGIVPGPAFSTGRFLFMLAPRDASGCSIERDDCAAISGIASDVCVASTPGGSSGFCHFGPCGSDPQSPCGLRLSGSVLIVRDQAENFVDAQVGVHVASSAVVDAYRGHFSVVSFYSDVDADSGNGALWVVGRDSFWGAPGLPMLPYLMFHPISNGVLGEPMYFAGMLGDEASFSADANAARPIYDEDKILNQHGSLSYAPDLDGGTWLLLYGGHAQPALRDQIGQFVQPVSDALFYDRSGGIYLRTAKQPWGPWSKARVVFDPYAPGEGGYCEGMYFDDPLGKSGFSCPASQLSQNDALNRDVGIGMAGEYGAAIVPNRVTGNADRFSFQWLVSTWNPYRVLLMQTTLDAATQVQAP